MNSTDNQYKYSASGINNPTQPVKKSSGCLPFTFGFFTGLFFPLIMMAVIGVVFSLYGESIVKGVTTQAMSTYYQEAMRDQIEASLDLPESEKKEVMQALDKMMEDFPNMSPEEIHQEMMKIMGDPNLNQNNSP
jgi:uncharacterized membrane protein (DUF106 family)